MIDSKPEDHGGIDAGRKAHGLHPVATSYARCHHMLLWCQVVSLLVCTVTTSVSVAAGASLPDAHSQKSASSPSPRVLVWDGPEVEHLRAGLDRIGCPFRTVRSLSDSTLSPDCVLVLAGASPPLTAGDVAVVRSFVQSGGAVLGIGGGATWMIDHQLFDAKGYCMTGTTIHMAVFHGYHRLTFGYPGPKPQDGWTAGVPMLLRATQGPLIEPGPQAMSILGCGGPFSVAALQRMGKGLILLIGPDPQGGNAYYSLDRPTLTTGDKLGTDRLLANAIAFLQDPGGNQVPNAGFEENTELPPAQSNWQITLRGGATSQWCRQAAPEGNVFLRLISSQASGSAAVGPYRPLVVERGSLYEIRCLYKSTLSWTVATQFLEGAPVSLTQQDAPPVSVTPSSDWKELATRLAVPAKSSYAKISFRFNGAGELCLDRLLVQRVPSTR